MKIWKFLFASGALATTPTAAQTTCFTAPSVAGATNNCVGLYGDEGTCKTTCSNGGNITHKCQCHNAQGVLLQNCKWDSTPGTQSNACTVDYLRIDFDVAYKAVGTTTIKATHEPLLTTYFKTLVATSESFSVAITGFTETVSSGNTDVKCKVTIRFDDKVTPSGWAAVNMNGGKTGATYNFATVSTGLNTSLGASKIVGTSTVSYEKVMAANPNAATDLLREVDAKEHVLATITTKKTEKSTQESLKTTKTTEKTTLQGQINQLKSSKSTKTTTKNGLGTTKTSKQGELNTAKGKVTAKQAEIDAVKL